MPQVADKSPAQNIGQKMGHNKQPLTTGKPANAMNRPVNMGMLIPALEAQIDAGKAVQLRGLYAQLQIQHHAKGLGCSQSDDSYKTEFMQRVVSLVGLHMVHETISKLRQGQMMENTSNQPAQTIAKPSGLPTDNNAIKQERGRPFSVHGLGKQHQQEHMPFTQSLVSNYGNMGRSYSSPNMNMSPQSFKPHTHDFTSSLGLQQSSSQPLMQRDRSLKSSMAYVKQEPLGYMKDQQHNHQTSVPQGPSSVSLFEPLEEETFEFMSSSPVFSAPINTQEPITVTAQLECQNVPAGNSSLAAGGNAKNPQKTPSVRQKNPSEALVSSLSKKQKVSEALLDQSIEQLNDVTAVSGVNLREEKDQSVSGSKEDSQLSEAPRKAVEEEERPILQKTHMIECGGQSSDVEPCSSQLPDDDGNVEHCDSNQEHHELVENLYPMSDSVEKFTSPQSDIICSYKVKRSNVTILKAIFKKHGDIAANCIFRTLAARTYHLDAICEVVKHIQTHDLVEMGEDIECQVSDAEAAHINVSWIREHFDAIRTSKKTSENLSLLMAMKEKMMLVIQAAEVDRAKRSLELSAADKRVRALHLFEQNLDDNILKSKEKIDSLVKHSLV